MVAPIMRKCDSIFVKHPLKGDGVGTGTAFATPAAPFRKEFCYVPVTSRRPRSVYNARKLQRRALHMRADMDDDDFNEEFGGSESANGAFQKGLAHPTTEEKTVETENGVDALARDEEEVSSSEAEVCVGDIVFSAMLVEYREQKEAGLLPPALDENPEHSDAWGLAVSPQKAVELTNQYSRVGVLMAENFPDFIPNGGCEQAFAKATLEEITLSKARAVYEGTGLPGMAETHDLMIEPPESNGRLNRDLKQSYYTRKVEEEGDALIDRVRPVSDENRITKFTSAVAYYDGEVEVVMTRVANVAIIFSGAHYATVAIAAAFDALYIELTRRFGLSLDNPSGRKIKENEHENDDDSKVLVGAAMLRERILREGKLLNDGIIKVSSFVNHMVDTELMEVCGEELAERLRHTMPNKLLTVESTGLIAGLPTARRLGIPLVFARKSRPITISDSYQTSYRSATKGVTSELIVSCEYLEAGDRVLIIDDFLAGGSTAEALFKLAKMAHAKVVGVGVLIEKMSDGGRAFLSGYDVPVESLAKILPGGDRGRINLVDEEAWVPRNVRKERELEERRKATLFGAQGSENEEMELQVEDEDEEEGEVDVIKWDDEDDVLGEYEDDDESELYRDLDDLQDELLRSNERT